MSGAEVALILTGLGSFVGALFAAIRSLRADKVTESERQTSAAMASQSTLIKTLQTELQRVRDDFNEERLAWRSERDELRDEVRKLKARVHELETQPGGTP